MGDAGLVPRFAPLPGWDPFRSRERLNALWSAAAVPSVTGGAAIAYRTLFQTLRRLVVGRTLTVRTNGNDLKLTVTEFDFRVEVRGLAVGQVGDVLLVAEDVGWREYRFEQAMAVLSNVHFRPGATSEIVAAPVELSLKLPAEVLEDLVAHASPQFIAHIDDDGVVRLRWARRPGWGHLEVDIRIVGTALWLQPRALVVGGRRLGLPARLPIYPVELPGPAERTADHQGRCAAQLRAAVRAAAGVADGPAAEPVGGHRLSAQCPQRDTQPRAHRRVDVTGYSSLLVRPAR